MEVKFKKVKEGAKLPMKATAGSAAYDLYAPEDVIIKPGRQVLDLGFCMEMPDNIQALVNPRSGFSSKGMEGYLVLTLVKCEPNPDANTEANSYKIGKDVQAVLLDPERFDCDVIEGKIDSDYRGPVGVILCSRDERSFLIKAGTRIAQMTFTKVETIEWDVVDELSETDRDGGFGSTGA